MKSQGTVDDYINKSGSWKILLGLLQKIFISEGLTEEIKWGGPVYTFQNRNIAGMAYFTSYVAIWFYQGAMLKDKNRKLVNAQEGVTKALRQWRFTSVDEIKKETNLVKEYIKESLANQKAGKIIKKETGKPLIVPPALIDVFKKDKTLQNRFDLLPLTKKRDFSEYISTAKTSETILKRLDKIIPLIMAGTGLNDKYKNR